MTYCSLGGFIGPDHSIRYEYRDHNAGHSVSICGGWITPRRPTIDRPTTPPPPADQADPMAECVAVPPNGFWHSAPSAPPDDARAYLIRIDYEDGTDSGWLSVFVAAADGTETQIAHGLLSACGTAMWTFDVNR